MSSKGWARRTNENGPFLVNLDDEMVTAGLSEDGEQLWVSDDECYYPRGEYAVPLADIDWLRSERPR